MLNQDFKPLLPRQRFVAALARKEMEIHEAPRRVELGTATADDAATIRHALKFLTEKPTC